MAINQHQGFLVRHLMICTDTDRSDHVCRRHRYLDGRIYVVSSARVYSPSINDDADKSRFCYVLDVIFLVDVIIRIGTRRVGVIVGGVTG